MRTVVYTVITEEYDNLRPPQYISPGIDHVCFTDIHRDVPPWQVRPFPMLLESGRQNSRIPKILPHLLLPDAEISIYTDGGFRVGFDVGVLAEQLLRGHDLAMYMHPGGHRSYHDERNFYQKLHGYVPDDVEAEYQAMVAANVPVTHKFFAGGVIIRRHSARTQVFNELWMKYHRAGSDNDQFSLYRAMIESGVQVVTIPGVITMNDKFGYNLHASTGCGDNPQYEAHNAHWSWVRREIRRLCNIEDPV